MNEGYVENKKKNLKISQGMPNMQLYERSLSVLHHAFEYVSRSTVSTPLLGNSVTLPWKYHCHTSKRIIHLLVEDNVGKWSGGTGSRVNFKTV